MQLAHSKLILHFIGTIYDLNGHFNLNIHNY